MLFFAGHIQVQRRDCADCKCETRLLCASLNVFANLLIGQTQPSQNLPQNYRHVRPLHFICVFLCTHYWSYRSSVSFLTVRSACNTVKIQIGYVPCNGCCTPVAAYIPLDGTTVSWTPRTLLGARYADSGWRGRCKNTRALL